jgi:putative component of toxin-antitoxin plasmid stabilization module
MQVEVRQHHGSESRFYFLQHGQLAAGQLLFLQLEE